MWCLLENTHLTADLLSASRLLSTHPNSLPALGGTVDRGTSQHQEASSGATGGCFETAVVGLKSESWDTSPSPLAPGETMGFGRFFSLKTGC